METKITTPVLFIAFNRPDVVKESFGFIRAAKPRKLFVAIDCPRHDKDNEVHLVEQVKKIVKNVDWDCQVQYKFNEKNLGAEVTVSSAVSWVLENEEYVIVLEDDIIAPFSFFHFAQEMLDMYKDIDNIYMISSCNTTPMKTNNNVDYFFAVYGHTWGWATWKRAWIKFDLYINDFDQCLDDEFLDKHTYSLKEKRYWKSLMSKMKQMGSGNNNWDYCWMYVRFRDQALSIVPSNHLSSNIGIYGLHANGKTEHHFKSFDENFIVNKHPERIDRNIEYDKHHFKFHIIKKPSLIKRAINKLKRVF